MMVPATLDVANSALLTALWGWLVYWGQEAAVAAIAVCLIAAVWFRIVEFLQHQRLQERIDDLDL